MLMAPALKMTPSVNTVSVCLWDCSPLWECLNMSVSYVRGECCQMWTSEGRDAEGSRRIWAEKTDERMRVDGMANGWIVASLLSWAPACFISTPADPQHPSSSSSSSCSPASKTQTESTVTVLMAAPYSLSPPHTPPSPQLYPGRGAAIIDN